MDFIIYIAVAVAVGLLMGFTVLSILWLRQRLKSSIREHTLGLISVYDELLEEKSHELSELQSKIADLDIDLAERDGSAVESRAEKAKPDALSKIMLSTVERVAGATYRDSAAGELYQTIHDSFDFRVEELLPGMVQSRSPDTAERRLLSQLDYDTVYRLSTLEPEQQLSILRDSLPASELPVLDEYIQGKGSFDILAFYDSLRFTVGELNERPRLYVSSASLQKSADYVGIELIDDSEICDGFRAELDGKLYDYCLTKRELS